MVKKGIILFVVALIIGVFFHLNLQSYLTLEFLQQNKSKLLDFYQQNQFLMMGIFFGVYVIITAISLPGAAIMTLAGGAIFGRVNGLFLVSFSSSIGATLAFLIARTLLGESLQKKYETKFKAINKGVEEEGAFYLASLRLMPIFPFFLINILMGLTKMPALKFYIVSQIAMLPGTFVYVNAGTALSKIQSLKDILSPSIFGSFLLLGLFPVIIKFIMKRLKLSKNIETV